MILSHEIAYKSFQERIGWTLWDNPEAQDLGPKELQARTDFIRETVIPLYKGSNKDLATQWLGVHKWHLYRNEHLVLEPAQAQFLLLEDVKVDGLGGILRGEQLPFGMNIGSVGVGPPYQAVEPLYTKLAQTGESLFPATETNPAVNKDSIYHNLSLIQYAFLLIHPHFEANGRTSRDILYTLWQRRPDLQDTIRFLSPTGLKDGDSLTKHINSIGEGLHSLNIQIAKDWGMKESDLRINDFQKLYTSGRLLSDAMRINPLGLATSDDYKLDYSNKVGLFVEQLLANPDEAIRLPVIDNLAQNLANASQNYFLADGSVLK